MDPALTLVKRENESLLERLKNIWLEQYRDRHSSDEPIESTGERLEIDSTLGRFITCTEGFKKELRTLE
jgi:hypothetical protein